MMCTLHDPLWGSGSEGLLKFVWCAYEYAFQSDRK